MESFIPSNKTSKDRISVMMDTLVLLFFPLMIVAISGVILFSLFPNSETLNLLIIAISMGLGFCILPYLYLKRQYNVEFTSFGIKSLSKLDCLLLLLVFGGVSSYLLWTGETYSFVFLNSVQMLIVASTEEFWARGAICYILSKINNNPWFIIIVSSICFAFLTHINEPFIDNLIYRLPGALIMGFIFVKTKNLVYTILFHFSYNMLTL